MIIIALYRIFLFLIVLFLIFFIVSSIFNGVKGTIEIITDYINKIKYNKKKKLSEEELEEFKKKGFVPYKK